MSRRTFAALVLVLCVLASTSVAAYGAGAQTTPTTNATEPAEEAYVTEGGDVILVYEGNSSDVTGSGYAGINVSEGVVYGIFRQTGLEANVTGGLSLVANRSAVNASGNLSVPRPRAVKNLRLRVESVQSPTKARSDATLHATIALPGRAKMATAVLQQFKTEGQFRTGPETLTITGTANWSTMLPMAQKTTLQYDLRATDGGHVLEAKRSGVISEFAAERWNTRAKAKQRLNQRFESLTAVVNGASEVTLTTYDFKKTSQGARLSLAYTVQIEGLNRLVRKGIVTGLAQSARGTPGTSAIDRAAIRENVSSLSIERASVSYSMGPTGGHASWNLSVDGYQGVARAYLTVLQARGGAVIANQSERYKAQLEAMAAADFERTVSWQLNATSGEGGTITIDGQLHGRTTNWEAYVEERSARDLPPVGTQRLTLLVESTNDTIDAEGSLLVKQTNLYNRTLDRYRRLLKRMSERATDDSLDQALSWLGAFERAGFRTARLDVAMNATTVTIESGAAFENLSSLTGRLRPSVGNATLERAILKVDDGSTAYVRLDGVVAGDGDVDAVRDLPAVSDETTVHTASEWNSEERSFPSLNTTAVEQYLGVSDSESGGGVPIVAAAGIGGIAVIGAVSVIVYRQRDADDGFASQ